MDLEEEGYFEISPAGEAEEKLLALIRSACGGTVHAAMGDILERREAAYGDVSDDEVGGGREAAGGGGVAGAEAARTLRRMERAVLRAAKARYARTKRGREETQAWRGRARVNAFGVCVSFRFWRTRATRDVSTRHTTWYPSHASACSPKNFTGPPSVVLVTASTFTSQYVAFEVKLTSMGKKLSPFVAGTTNPSIRFGCSRPPAGSPSSARAPGVVGVVAVGAVHRRRVPLRRDRDADHDVVQVELLRGFVLDGDEGLAAGDAGPAVDAQRRLRLVRRLVPPLEDPERRARGEGRFGSSGPARPPRRQLLVDVGVGLELELRGSRPGRSGRG